MGKNNGCLIIHGFGGSVYEVSPLAAYLEERGYQVICPTLKGHTGRKKDLRGVTYDDWLTSAEEGLFQLISSCDRVFVIGFSMGGLIAINLGIKYKIHGLVTINSPIYYWNLKRICLNIINGFKERDYRNIRRYWKASRNIPLETLFQFKSLLLKTKPIIKKIRCPLLVIQTIDDDTVKSDSAKYIHIKADTEKKKLKFYEKGGHLALRSITAQSIMEDVRAFFGEIEEIEQG